MLIGLGSGPIIYQLANGLETSLVLAAVMWSLALAADQTPRRSLPALCGLLPFIRPELALLSGVLMARQAWLRWRNGERSSILGDFTLSGVVASPWLVWSLVETGSVMPNTAGAKVAFFAENGLPAETRWRWVANALWSGLGLIIIAPWLVRRSSLAMALWTFCAVFVLAFYARFPGGLSHNIFRYTYALLPVGLWALGDLWATRREYFWRLGTILAILAPSMMWLGFHSIVMAQPMLADEFAAVAWVKANVPPAQAVLVHDAGVPGYASQARLIDVVGLKTPAAAKEHFRLTLPTGGSRRDDADDAIARSASVRYAIILEDGGFWASVGNGLRLHGWRLERVRAPTIQPGYAVYRLTPSS
jgi:hypothetical protein